MQGESHCNYCCVNVPNHYCEARRFHGTKASRRAPSVTTRRHRQEIKKVLPRKNASVACVGQSSNPSNTHNARLLRSNEPVAFFRRTPTQRSNGGYTRKYFSISYARIIPISKQKTEWTFREQKWTFRPSRLGCGCLTNLQPRFVITKNFPRKGYLHYPSVTPKRLFLTQPLGTM